MTFENTVQDLVSDPYYFGRGALLPMMADNGLRPENESAGATLVRRVQERAFVFRREAPTR